MKSIEEGGRGQVEVGAGRNSLTGSEVNDWTYSVSVSADLSPSLISYSQCCIYSQSPSIFLFLLAIDTKLLFYRRIYISAVL